MAIELKVPEVGEAVTEVYIGQWYASEGQRVQRDENVVELESEKATFDVPAPAAGVVRSIKKQTGETAGIGEVIAEIEESEAAPEPGGEKRGERPPAEEARPAEGEEAPAPEEGPRREAAVAEEGRGVPREEPPASAEQRIMPAAQRVLAEHGLKPEEVEATGPGGRLLKEDVLRHVERERKETDRMEGRPPAEPGPEPAPGREEEVVPMSPIRRRIAQRLVEASQNAALLTTFNEVEMTAVQTIRRKHRETFQEKYGIRLGIMSFFVKATIEALKEFPQLNAEIRDNNIVYHNYYDIGIAIAGDRGLIVPILRNAERMSFAEIEQAIDDFARRARENRLQVEELTGGTFTITNGGVFGSLMSTPIINPPQSGVLGMHAIQERPVVRDGQIVARPMMYVALTYDHRIVDGREAVSFLRRLKEILEAPSRILLEV